jgi:hypothetical protein
MCITTPAHEDDPFRAFLPERRRRTQRKAQLRPAVGRPHGWVLMPIVLATGTPTRFRSQSIPIGYSHGRRHGCCHLYYTEC